VMLNDPFFRHLPPDDPNYILGQFVARSSVKPLQLHIDAGMPQLGPATTMVQLGFVLEDMDEKNGCTMVVPGSHLLGEYSDRELEHLHPIPARSGDILVWDARVWHGSGSNTAEGTRWNIVATFQRWWVKQSFDIPRALPQEIFDELTDQQKALLGFCTIPPLDENERRTRARPYSDLPSRVGDFYRRS
jgi:ectoine hydroxylase-related dioxygenase (phytanoyl-CoA dioxygenase family)